MPDAAHQPDELQLEVARIALAAVRGYGYALGGGLALVMHGLVDRPTQDIDVFGPDTIDDVRPAATAMERALRSAGFTVERAVGSAPARPTGMTTWSSGRSLVRAAPC